MEAKKSASEFDLGMKSESMLKGKEAMLGPDMMIHENSNESEVLFSEKECLSCLDTEEKRMKINAGAMNSQFSAEDEHSTQMIDLGLQEPDGKP